MPTGKPIARYDKKTKKMTYAKDTGVFDSFNEERGLLNQALEYGIYGVSPSTYKQAKKDLWTITKNAPADQEWASIFTEDHPNFRTRMYRHLEPSDSTVTYHSGGTFYSNDGVGGHMGKSYDELLLDNAKQMKKASESIDGKIFNTRGSTTPQQAAMELARYRASKL